ncbi:MAG: histone [Halodesulfurarchaeum sp.]
MSVELPVAPVDTLIRREAGDLRVSADAAAELARRIQEHGARVAARAAARAEAEGRKTIMVEDFERSDRPAPESLTLPVAPVDRIARLDIDSSFRVSEDARLVLADVLESFALDAAAGAAILAEHADRRTIQAEDVETYFRLVE